MSAEPANLDDAAPSTRRVPRWVRALPVLVLLVAIIGQLTLMTTVNIDRQTGSGFAMFSSVDFAGSRSVVATATFDGLPVTVSFPASLNDDVDQLLYAPTHSGAEKLAARLAEFTWSEGNGRVAVGDDGTIRDVTVSVRGLTADGHTLGSEILALAVAQ